MSTLYTTTYPNTQLAQVQPAQRPAYAFLAYPPPQKKRPTQPLPSPPAPKRVPCSQPYPRRRSASSSAISTWVSAVQPGSPAPCSPRRRSSISSPRRSSYGSSLSRRPSVSSTPRSATFLALSAAGSPTRQVITPNTASDFKPDLTACGYTSVFVHCPDTPLSATIPLAFAPGKVRPPPTFIRAPPSPTKQQPARGLKHFRSLTALKTARRARSKSGTMQRPPSSPLKSPTHASRAASRAQAREAVSASKKSKYAKFRPPPLATELALAQLADGGSIEDHIRRFAEAQAKAGGATRGPDGRLVGVADVYRDGAGGVWRDQDEEWEYAHLLGGDEEWCESEASWVRFGSSPVKPRATPLLALPPRKHSAASADSDDRRGSVSSADSDLDPRYAMQAEDEGRDDLAAFGSALAPACARRPGMSVLAIPARTRRTAPHLRKPEFLLDAFPVPVDEREKQARHRHRPAPLTLAPPSPAFKCPTNPLDPLKVRGDFIASSFRPAPAPSAAPAPAPTSMRRAPEPMAVVPPSPREASSKKTSGKIGMRGLFRAMGGKKGDL